MKKSMYVAGALLCLLVAGNAEARKHPRTGSLGGTTTNYGCTTFAAGTVLRSPDNLSQTTLTASTYGCYLCNLTTRVCTLQSPASLVGWTFIMP